MSSCSASPCGAVHPVVLSMQLTVYPQLPLVRGMWSGHFLCLWDFFPHSLRLEEAVNVIWDSNFDGLQNPNRVITKLFRISHRHGLLSRLLAFEANTISALNEDRKCTRPNLGPKPFFEMRTVNILLDLRQGCQWEVIFRSWWDEQLSFGLISLRHSYRL